MSTKEMYSEILGKIYPSSYSRLSRQSTKNIYTGLEIIKDLLENSSNSYDEVALKKECDYILVGTLIYAMAKSDDYYYLELSLDANQGTDSHLGDFFYPISGDKVFEGSGAKSFKDSLNFIGRRVLESKELPFTGTFNPACYHNLNDAFDPNHFSEYGLNTDPTTMIHPLTKIKLEKKAIKQEALEQKLTSLESNLLRQLVDAAGRSSDRSTFSGLVKEVNVLITELKTKLNQRTATLTDVNAFKTKFSSLMATPENVAIMNAHRGSFIGRGIMDALAKIEAWIRQIPALFALPIFSLAPKDTFFSTKTARIVEDTCDKVSYMAL